MAMPKGWGNPSETVQQSKEAKDSDMPSPTELSRPMISRNNLVNYNYPIKKIEIIETSSREQLHPKNVRFLQVRTIESDYSLVLNDGYNEDGLSFPFQNLIGIRTIDRRNGKQAIELSFKGSGIIGDSDKQYTATIVVEEKHLEDLFTLIKKQKDLQRATAFWSREPLLLNLHDQSKIINVYPLIPFLADGEDMIWQRLHFRITSAKTNKVNCIDAVTNYRIFRYDYDEHKGMAILFSSLQNISVPAQQRTSNSLQMGNYFISSFNLTGIKGVRTNNVVGDILFEGKENSTIKFEQITDPETLVLVVNKLKQLYDQTGLNSVGNELRSETKCTRCGSVNSSSDSKFCGNCGFSLSNHSEVKPIYVDNPSLEPTALQNPEQVKTERLQNLIMRIDQYKPAWDKNGVIQYKTEYIAILQRSWGRQVEFIIAFDDLTKEGYRLMAIDEGKSDGDSSGGFTGGVNAYFYFQKIK